MLSLGLLKSGRPSLQDYKMIPATAMTVKYTNFNYYGLLPRSQKAYPTVI